LVKSKVAGSRRAEQGEQQDWIGEKAKSERIHVGPKGPAAVVNAQNVVCVMNQADNNRRADDDCRAFT
jgi:hypothetical protein